LKILLSAFHMLGAIHAAGLVQEDLHLGNFLRYTDQLYVIDGDAIRALTPGKPLDETRATSNLALLLAQLPTAWSVYQKNFLEAYVAGGGCLIADRKFLENELLRIKAWRLKDFLGKTVRDCTLFAVKHSMLRFTAVARREAEFLAPLLDEPDAAILSGRLLKDGNTCTVAQVTQNGHDLVIKRYNLKSIQHLLSRLLRPSRAWHSWRAGHLLQFLGIATPTPLALIEERFGKLRRRAFLLNEFCPGISLLDYLSPKRVPDNEVAQAIISLFKALHDMRISHGDLKASNLLWHEKQVFVIDLDALVRHASAEGYARAWRRDRARMLRNWPATSVLHQWLDKNLPPSN
jgi:tRNA A-37 threonylcarbamoyl transferase component Bud32